MVEGTCKNHHRGQICRVSHAFEAFPSRLSNSPHTQGSQGSSASVLSLPHHHHLAQGVAVCRQGVPLCILPKEAKQVWEPALNRQLRQQLSSGELLNHMGSSKRSVSTRALAPFWNLLSEVLCPPAQAVKGVKAIWPLMNRGTLLTTG